MATYYRTVDGLQMKVLTDSERNKEWREILSTDVSVVGKNIPLETPRDNLKYYILSETETTFQKYTVTIKANGKTATVKCNICNQDIKINAAVRKLYNQ